MDLRSQIAKLFKSGMGSDVTLRFVGREVKAHQWVLSASSEYFTKAFNGSFNESSTKVIELHDDDPDALNGLLAMMYGLDSHRVWWFRQNVFRTDDDYDRLSPEQKSTRYGLYLVDMYIAARKYLVQEAAARGQDALCHPTIQLGKPSVSHEVLKHIYITHPEAAFELRAAVVEQWVGCLKRHSKRPAEQTESAQKLIKEIPEFAVDALTALGA
ncbi:hypothetical protein LTR49_020253 [Elasticomyces elasticus]|nr:hypothetical protein LTR49_020253 [Elasticomyces elasticus]KAK5748018.1 hypothetical protein LTS12_021947 [Elasticomyces elasticus]